MRVLIVHNRYQIRGGEDTVFEAETKLLRENGVLVETLEYSNFDISGFKGTLLTGLRAIYNRKAGAILRDKAADFQPDIIHIHNLFPIGSPSVLFVARALRIPVVKTLHNYRLICPSASLFFEGKIYLNSIHKIFPLDAVKKGVYRDSKTATFALALMTAIHKVLGTFRNKVNRFIALTDFARDIFLNSSLSIRPEQITVKPNFVFDLPVSGDRGTSFLYVGRLTEEKGILPLLQAFEGLDAELEIVGTGPMDQLVREYEARCPNIRYLGTMPNELIRQKMYEARALVFPSLWYEGLPMTIIEAYATGTPVIASNLGAMSTVVTNEKNGLHFGPGNIEELRACVRRLKENEDLRYQLGTRARADYLSHYSPAQNFRQLERIYREVIEQYQK